MFVTTRGVTISDADGAELTDRFATMPPHPEVPTAPLRPKRGDDVAGARAPVVAGQDRPLDAEGIHQRECVQGERRLIHVARCAADRKVVVP